MPRTMRSLQDSPRRSDPAEVSSNSAPKKSVSFDKVTILEFPMILGDNPGCHSGVPVQIDWEPMMTSTKSLAMYEYLRESNRRTRKKLILSEKKRAKMMIETGYSMNQLVKVCVAVDEIRENRRESLRSQGWDRFAIALETTGRLPTNAMKGVLGMTGEIWSTTGNIVQMTGRAVTATGMAVVNTGAAGTRSVFNTGAAVVSTGADVLSTTGGLLVSTTGGILNSTGRTLKRIVPRSKSPRPPVSVSS